MSELRAAETAMNSHTHTQHEVGSIPTVSESSWANQIINLQGLNYIASVHTYCHITDTATGTHTHTQTHTHTHTHTHTLPPSLAVCRLSQTHTNAHTHTRDTEAANIKQLNLNFGQVLCMIWIKRKTLQAQKKAPQLFDAIYSLLNLPSFLPCQYIHVSETQRSENKQSEMWNWDLAVWEKPRSLDLDTRGGANYLVNCYQ